MADDDEVRARQICFKPIEKALTIILGMVVIDVRDNDA
jgi:hypothetical protein